MSVIKRIGLLLILVPIIGATISFTYSTLVTRGTFVKWVFVGAPPEGKATKVIWADYVEIDSGDLYHLEFNDEYPNNVHWIKSVISSSYFASDSSSSSSMGCIGPYNLPQLDRFSDSKIVCQPWGDGVFLTITAIDDAGNVYSWKKGSGTSDGINVFLSPFVGAFFGALVMIPFLIVGLAMDSAKLKEKHGQK